MASFKMIEINLLPPELKTKSKITDRVRIESKYIVYLIGLVFAILIATHIYLAAVNIIRSCQFSVLNNKWQRLEPQRKILEGFKQEYRALSEDARIVQQWTQQRINWAEKLNKLSLNLPSGVWFNEVSLSNKEFTLSGSTVSLEKKEMGLINKFLDNLKKDAVFSKDFNNLELSSVEMGTTGGYDIVSFILTGTLKNRDDKIIK